MAAVPDIDTQGIESKLTSIKNALDKEFKRNGDIVQTDASTFNDNKISGSLSSNEQKREKTIGSIHADAWFKAQKSLEKDTKEKTIVSESKEKAKVGKALKEGNGENGGFDGWLGGGLLLLYAAREYIMEKWKEFKNYLSDSLGGIGDIFGELMDTSFFKFFKVDLYKSVYKTFAWLGKLKMFTKGGGLLSKIFAPYRMVFTGIGKFIRGIGSLGKGIGGAWKGLKAIPGVGLLFKGIGKAGWKIGSKVLKVLKFLPFIGSIISFGEAYDKFKNKGDWVGGTIALLSGIANLFPGPGTLISIALDGVGVLRDMYRQKQVDNGLDPDAEGTPGWWNDLASDVGDWIMENMEYIPFLSSIWAFGKAGETTGWTSFKWAIAGVVGLTGASFLQKGAEKLLGLHSKEAPPNPEDLKSDSTFWDDFSDITAGIADKISNAFDDFNDWASDGLVGLAQSYGFVPKKAKILPFKKSKYTSPKDNRTQAQRIKARDEGLKRQKEAREARSKQTSSLSDGQNRQNKLSEAALVTAAGQSKILASIDNGIAALRKKGNEKAHSITVAPPAAATPAAAQKGTITPRFVAGRGSANAYRA